MKDTPNNQSRATIIFNDLINKRKELMSKLYDSVDYNNLNFKYVGPTKDVSFMNTGILKNNLMQKKKKKKKSSQIKFTDAVNKQKEFLNKLNDVKIGKKNLQQIVVIDNLEHFYKSREETVNFFRDYIEMLSDANYNAKQNETKGKGLKILTPKQMLQRLPIALAQVKAGNNSEIYQMKYDKLFIHCISPKKLLKKYTTT